MVAALFGCDSKNINETEEAERKKNGHERMAESERKRVREGEHKRKTTKC